MFAPHEATYPSACLRTYLSTSSRQNSSERLAHYIVQMKPAKILPPDPRPSKAHPQHREARKQIEKKYSDGFEWIPWLALALTGAAVAFDIEKDVRKCEEKKERKEREREREKERERRGSSAYDRHDRHDWRDSRDPYREGRRGRSTDR